MKYILPTIFTASWISLMLFVWHELLVNGDKEGVVIVPVFSVMIAGAVLLMKWIEEQKK